jgi:hypothetical protein
VNGCAIIATHHKTGTVWMRSIFQGIARLQKTKFVHIKRSVGLSPDALRLPSIVFNNHSDFRMCGWLLEHPRSRIFHLIRDPRDIVLSAARHHQTAAEPWLHKPMRAFGGLTYQEKTNSLPDDQSRYMLEMQYSAKRTIKAIQKWDYNRPNTIECRYEELIDDSKMTKFTEVLSHLGFEDGELDACREIISNNSLFGKVQDERRGHIRSGHAQQWKTGFNAELAAEFVAAFGDVLIELGYEKDNAWVNSLPRLSEESGPTDGRVPAGRPAFDCVEP